MQASRSLDIAEIAAVVRRLIALGRPKNKALHDVATTYVLTAAQVKSIISLI